MTTLVSFDETIELIKKQLLLESTKIIVLILWKMSDIIQNLFPQTQNHHITIIEQLHYKEEKPEEERTNKFKASDMDSYLDVAVKHNMIHDKDQDLHFWPQSVPKHVIDRIDTNEMYQSKL